MPVLAFFAAFFGVRLFFAVMRRIAWCIGWVAGYASESRRGGPIPVLLSFVGAWFLLRVLTHF